MTRVTIACTVMACLSAVAENLVAQEEQLVMQPIHQLFDAMRSGDSASARSVFHPDARLIRLPIEIEDFRVAEGTVDGFVAAVGGNRGDSWDEPIWDWEVRVDGNLAAVWTKYAFFRSGEFSHCGVDTFQLANTPHGWRILSLAYSRREDECEPPPSR
jgi:hypothetical protein